eukprot:SAG31_NODE_220_length_19925_cov_3.630939_17_plen_287_part_00
MIAAVAQPPASTQTGSNRNQPKPTETSQDQAATAGLHCPTAADIARSAQQLCGGSSVADSLQAIGLVRAENSAERSDLGAVLQANGLHTALDLRLLAAGGPEVAELMGQLRDGGISIGDRSKVRLLLGEVAARESEVGGATTRNPQATEDKIPAMATTEAGVSRRQLQQNSEGMSTDTIAIVLSVLVGAAGYVVQVCICAWPSTCAYSCSLDSPTCHNTIPMPLGVHGAAGGAQLGGARAGAARARGAAAAGPRADGGADCAHRPGGGRLLCPGDAGTGYVQRVQA